MNGTASSLSGRMLRVSVTPRCNFHCRYCRPPGSAADGPREHPLPLQRMAELIAWLHRRTSIRSLKITGGEPLLRAGLTDWIAGLSLLGVGELSLTSNGSRLAGMAAELAAAGLARVNVSLDTLDPARFRELTGRPIAPTLAGIDAAVSAGLTPLKLNSVLTRSRWRNDVPALLDFAAERGLTLRFIELMRTGPTADWARKEFVPAGKVRDQLAAWTEVTDLSHRPGCPARESELSWHGRTVRVGWITPYSDTFCDGCDRLRLDSTGKLHRCLMDETAFPLHRTLNGHSPDDGETVRDLDTYLTGKRAPRGRGVAAEMIELGG